MKRLSRLSVLAVLVTSSVCIVADATTIITRSPRGHIFETTVTLRARSLERSGVFVERCVRVPGETSVELPVGLWEISVDALDAWAERRVVRSSDDPVIYEVWPGATIRGTLAGPPLPAALHLAFTPSGTGEVRKSADAACVIDADRFRCVAPNGELDLRFGVPGYSPVFRWGVATRAGAVADVGKLTFVRGPSLLGWIESDAGATVLEKTVVTAEPRGTGWSASAALTTRVDNRGFFQFTGLPAGDYMIRGRSDQLSTESRAVHILADRNAELRSPLILSRPHQLRLTIDAPPSEDLEPWRVELMAADRDAARLESVAKGVADQRRWSHPVQEGSYLLKVLDRAGATWWSDELAVTSGDVSVEANISVTNIRGRITIGDRPLPATLTFGGERRATQKQVTTDHEGRFTSVVPASAADGDRWTIDVAAESPSVRRTLDGVIPTKTDDGALMFDLRLPARVVTGRVTDADGTAAADAIITLQEAAGHEFHQVFADEQGDFGLQGVAPGRYRVSADAFLKASDVVEIDVGDDTTAPVLLILRNQVRVKGRVISTSSPVIGATVSALPRDTATSLLPSTTTNESGAFDLGLPPGTRTFDLVVRAFGFATMTGRAHVLDGKQVVVVLHQAGGRLILDLPVGADATLSHGGGEYSVAWLARITGGAIDRTDERSRTVLPNLAPGDYRLCINGRCASGIVAPNGELTLSLE